MSPMSPAGAPDGLSNWLGAIQNLDPQATPAVLVTVAAVHGSAPREPGARMLVRADTQVDTIGGGHLELQACAYARNMLKQAEPPRRVERFALGPSLGQCCGGVVHLAFERLDAQACADFALMAREREAGRDLWRLTPFEDASTALLLDANGRGMANADPGEPAQEQPNALAPRFDPQRPCHLLRDTQGSTWLVDPCRADRAHLVLFGAGHVGAALVRALAALPCRITWVDEREDLFPRYMPDNVRVECTDTPEAVVAAAAPGTSFLVMTHSHALDQRLAEAILRHDDVMWFGLIGSQTKRIQFERRLRARGIGEVRLKEMVCPIGIPGIRGKAPAVIAASVCAQLLQVWEAAAQQSAVPAMAGDRAA